MTVKWGKNAKATGYQVQYCPDKTFKTGNKSVTVSGATVSKEISGLVKGKTCTSGSAHSRRWAAPNTSPAGAR